MTRRAGNAQSVVVMTKCRFIGDTVVAVPLLRAIRRAYPGSRIALLTGPAATAVLTGCPYVDDFICFDQYGSERGFRPFIRQMLAIRKHLRPDTCFLINTSFRSAVAALLCGARIRVGWPNERRGALLTHSVPYHGAKHEAECYLDLLRALSSDDGIDPYDPTLKLWVTDAEKAEGAAALAERGIQPGDRVIALHPGVHDAPTRSWPEERYAELGDRLAAGMDARILILGSREETSVAARVAGSMRGNPVVLAGQTGLRQTMALISNCNLWIGSDGGMLHTAVGLAPATVGIFGPTKDVRWGYHTSNHRTVVTHPERGPCDAAVIRRCLDAITVETVYQAASGALDASTAQRRGG